MVRSRLFSTWRSVGWLALAVGLIAAAIYLRLPALWGLAGLAAGGAASVEIAARHAAREQVLREQLAAQDARLAAVSQVADALSEAVELPELLGQGLERAVRALGLDGGQIHLVSDDDREMHLSQIFGYDSERWIGENAVQVGECICGQAAAGGEPIVVDDATSDPRLVGRACAAGGVPSLASVPLRSRSRSLGVLTVRSCNPHHFALQDVNLLTSVANTMAAAIENARIRGEMQERIADLTAEVQQLAILQERERLSREMHDGLAQTLGLLNLQIETVKAAIREADWKAAEQELKILDDYLLKAYRDVREALADLRSTTPQGEGFVSALHNTLEDFGIVNQIETSLITVEEDGSICFPPLVELQVHRVIQEALANVRRHAHANWLKVHIGREPEGYVLTVLDDGVGFDPLALPAAGGQHFGLSTMQERMESLGGGFEVASKPGEGTRVRLLVPCNGHDSNGGE